MESKREPKLGKPLTGDSGRPAADAGADGEAPVLTQQGGGAGASAPEAAGRWPAVLTAAHELRAPLAWLLGEAESLRE